MRLIYAQGHNSMGNAAALSIAGHVTMPVFETTVVDSGKTITRGFRHFELQFDMLSDSELNALLDETGVDEITPSVNCTVLIFDERGAWAAYNAVCAKSSINRDRRSGVIENFTLTFSRMEAL